MDSGCATCLWIYNRSWAPPSSTVFNMLVGMKTVAPTVSKAAVDNCYRPFDPPVLNERQVTAALLAAAATAAVDPVKKRSAAVPAAAALCNVQTSSSNLHSTAQHSTVQQNT